MSIRPVARLLPLASCCVLALLLGCAGNGESGAGVSVSAAPAAQPAVHVPLPNKKDTLHFGVIGDNGTGSTEQYEIGKQMLAWHDRFPFELVVMLGDNIYGADRPQDMERKFALPYKGLLDRGVKFYASLGNH